MKETIFDDNWKKEINSLIKLFNFIYINKKYINNKNKRKIKIKVYNQNFFIRTAIRHNFVVNVQNFMILEKKSLQQKIKYLSDLEVKKLMAITGYNCLISEVLQENKIPVIIYKGIILSLLTNRKFKDRQCNDIDILVNEIDVKKTVKILEKIGFTIKYGFFKNESNSLIEKYYLFGNNALTLSKKISSFEINIDLHWKIITTSPNIISFEELWNSRKIIELNGVKINTLNYYYTYLTCCYNSSKNKWNNISNLLDIALLKGELNKDQITSLDSNLVVKNTNIVVDSLLNDEIYKYQKGSKKVEEILILSKNSQIKHSKGTNKKKKTSFWEKFSLAKQRMGMCETYEDKLRVLVTVFFPVSIFISKKNTIIANPLFIVKNIFAKLLLD
ncbi:nucleotidyltransferase family protein [Prochlorococcus marinus XMU1412]|uniref:nucleotidyltransferase family protein n=1 Tax=Prochlorococcus marinus TaxID=1219 RepID=UPI001ADC0AB3|nr:nucleotidyltransferase family protein [Prochlorococcus marinus]MBO8240573.1 nucleotidyltransferase family protein [Prochlorococcus marinus XMU1412]MBW3071808.1 hypothetical protein [Prochlorococcus marinus str. MU1412]